MSLGLELMVYREGEEKWDNMGFDSDLLVLEVWDLQVVTTELEPCIHKLCGGGHAPAPSLLSTQSPLLPRTHAKAEITKDPLKAQTLNPRESVSRHPEQGCDCVFPKLNLRPDKAICLKCSAYWLFFSFFLNNSAFKSWCCIFPNVCCFLQVLKQQFLTSLWCFFLLLSQKSVALAWNEPDYYNVNVLVCCHK